jgi:serine/threonine protein phosphatase PrpC
MTAMAGQMSLRWGGATHPGRIRTDNEDNYLARDDVELWAVADGMGGHQGGEVASHLACDALGRAYAERTVDGLLDAIEQANAAIFETGLADPDLTGMGTTLVALASVDEDGEELLAVANVGDSRVYRLSLNELEQLTDDHSLVAELVREGSLSPEQAAVHPQRNIVTRVLGVDDRVPVDALTVEPVAGDRYLLCSDGLFNEVPEPEIVAVLGRLDDPAEAADELVRMAVEAGGRDNVTVVVVDVVEDGGRAEAASAALADEPSRTESDPAAVPAANGGDAGDAPAPGADPRTLDVDEAEVDRVAPTSAPRARRVTWRVVLFSFLVLALIGGAFATIQWYGRSTYFVGFEGDRVAIYKGRPGGVLWVDPRLEKTTELERADLPEHMWDDLEAGKEQSSLTNALTYVDSLEESVEDRDDAGDTDGTAGTTTTTERRTTTTAAGRRTTTTAP